MRVLLPTDFSENAWHAIQYAIYLFENIPCSFYILHAHQPAPSGLVSTINKERDTRFHQITQDEVEVKLQKIVGHLKSINKVTDHSFEAILESDSLLNTIGRNIIDKDIDFICMGTQGASGMKEIFMGSNTVSVLKSINFCPLLAIPGSFDFTKPSQIVFATDYKHLYQKVELEPMISLANIWNSTIRVIHMPGEAALTKENEEIKKLLARLLKGVSHSFEIIEYHPMIAYRINEWADENKSDLLVMINSQHGFFRRLLREPVIKKVAFKTHIPFLVLPEANNS
ncbi:MAG: universal stress protein [Flavobacteriaceae bacterium]